MKSHDLILVALALLSEFVGTLSGFGSSTFFVPGAVLFESFRFVLALTAILHCFGNITKIILFRKSVRMDLVLKLGLPSVVLAGIGAVCATLVPVDTLSRILGVVLVIVSLLRLFKAKQIGKFSLKEAGALCGISGLLTGLVGTGGAIRGLAFSALQLEKNSFVVLSSVVDMGGDLLRSAIYLREGYMDWSQWFYIPTLGIAAIVGSLLGKRVLNLLDQKQFEKVVAVFVCLSGLAMIVGKF